MSDGIGLTWSVPINGNSDEEKILKIYTICLSQHLKSRDVRSALIRLREMAATQSRIAKWEQILSAILLIETRERPPIVRFAERIVSIFFLRRATTCGHFQMRSSPIGFAASVCEAIKRLERGECNSTLDEVALEQIARFWHGAASRQHGESLSYSKALAIARDCLADKYLK